MWNCFFYENLWSCHIDEQRWWCQRPSWQLRPRTSTDGMLWCVNPHLHKTSSSCDRQKLSPDPTDVHRPRSQFRLCSSCVSCVFCASCVFYVSSSFSSSFASPHFLHPTPDTPHQHSLPSADPAKPANENTTTKLERITFGVISNIPYCYSFSVQKSINLIKLQLHDIKKPGMFWP